MMDKPDVGAPPESFASRRMMEEAGEYLIHRMQPDGALGGSSSQPSLLTQSVEDPKEWGTVTRGNPPAHLLPVEDLPAIGLTPDTWRLRIASDDFVDPIYARYPTRIGLSEEGPSSVIQLTFKDLQELGERHGTVKVVKGMQCLNVGTPLGQGLWEGLPLSTVLRSTCGRIENCRRIFYWGYHNDDPVQVFRSSVSYADAFEPVPGEPPVFVAYKLNGKAIPRIRGGPVRMIVPFGYGFKSVKFLQEIRLTNDYRSNDTYAAIMEQSYRKDGGNDPSSVQKTFTSVDMMLSAPPIKSGEIITLTGVLMNGRTPASHLEYWVRESKTKGFLADDDPELLNAPWVRFDIPQPPEDLVGALQLKSSEDLIGVFGIDATTRRPKQWPLPFTYVPWVVTIPSDQLKVGQRYEIRARSVDVAGNAQPQPRPAAKNGRNAIQVRAVHIADVGRPKL